MSRREKGATMNHFERAAAIVLLVGIVSGAGAFGQQAALTDRQVTERLAFIASALEAGQPRARTWLYGWLGAYSAGAATMGVLAAANWTPSDVETAGLLPVDNSFAQDMLVGGGTFALGVVGLAIDPFTPATAAKKLRALPETSPEERLAKLARAEELLRACARRERSGRGLVTHLLNAGVNAAAGVVTVAAFDRPAGDGLLTFAIGEAVSLLNIFTQPMRAARDLKRYEAGYPAAAAPSAPRATWSLGVRPGGFAFSLRF
jgi:hypothetical protein